MELENLKYIWKEQDTQQAPESSREELLALLQKGSQGPIARMRRNLRKEILFMVFTYVPIIIFYLLEFHGRLWPISALLFVLGVFFCAYYYRKYRLLNKMQCVTCEVRSNLTLQVRTLKAYTRFYLWASTAIVPLTAIFTYTAFRLQVYHRVSPAPWYKSGMFWLILLVPFTILIHYLNDCYINKLYGRHIKKLQELLREMDEE